MKFDQVLSMSHILYKAYSINYIFEFRNVPILVKKKKNQTPNILYAIAIQISKNISPQVKKKKFPKNVINRKDKLVGL